MEFEFVAGNLALDFVATVAERTTSRVERLMTAQQLSEWLVQAGVLDSPSRATDADLAAARELREAAYRLLRCLTDGRPVDAEDRVLLNRYASAPPPDVALTAESTVRTTGSVASALSVLARTAIRFADPTQRVGLRWCSDATCTRPFLDRSRGSRRRWCGMRGCGDRAKAAAYRRRRQPAPSPAPDEP